MKVLFPVTKRRKLIVTSGIAALMLITGFGKPHRVIAAPSQKEAGIGISDKAYATAVTRAKVLTSQMTLVEKIGQLGDKTAAIPRLKIPSYNYYSNEALHGLMAGPQITSFPVPLSLAASWNPGLAQEVYTAIADECRAYDNVEHGGLSFYSPVTLNLHRDPRWGRSDEAPGEDPCLASTIAVQVVRGMQGDDPNYLKTTACSKHFICNNTDDDREWISASVDQRSFWEFYTRAYRATVVHGDVFTFMSAYNALNGVPCSADRFLLTDLLRDQWGFRGYVTSDCDAIKDIYDPHHYATDFPSAAALGIKAGCDLNCWGNVYTNYLQEAVKRGLVSEAQISEAVTRLLTVRILLGTLDPPSTVPYSSITMANLPWKAHSALAVESARQSLVLLKNQDNILPLDPAKVKKIAVIGPLANSCNLGGYSGYPGIEISPLKGIADRLDLPLHLGYLSGDDAAELHGSIHTQQSRTGAMQLAFIKTGDWAYFKRIDLTGKTTMHVNISSASKGGRIEVHLDSLDGPIIAHFQVANTGGWEQYKELTAPLTGTAGAHSIFLLFKGNSEYLINVERIVFTPADTSQTIADSRQILYAAGCSVTGPRNESTFQEAVNAAKKADVVVMVCGINWEVSHEAHDRETIGLTGVQPELIQAVYAANPKTVLVLSSINSVSVVWEQNNLPAILCAICAGQAQGTAIAEALFGDYNPGGKLPCTWYRSLDQLPHSHDYDIHKGRTYQYFTGDPLYPFGYGLSYTTFQIDNLKSSSQTLGQGDTVNYSVRVTNTGKRAGAEVVQLYIAPPASVVTRPKRQLAGFQRVELKPGESKTVVFSVPYTDQPFWYWSDIDKRFVCQPGDATIEIGYSSVNLPLKATLKLQPQVNPLPQIDAVDTVAVKSIIE